MFETLALSLALIFGLAVRWVGLPPLVGFLVAGFILNVVSASWNGGVEEGNEALHYVAHWGVLLLLFTVGLKLKLGQITQSHVIKGGLLHFAVSVVIFATGLRLTLNIDWAVVWLIAIALSFSSTVLAAKILESKRELTSFHGRTAIGILIIQDLIALLVLSIWSDQTPTLWALMVFLLPLLRPLLHGLLNIAGHDELLLLVGMFAALVLGGMGFEMLGLSSELGALAMGMLLASHERAGDVAESLWGLKELFLVGFFLQIGMSGLPSITDWWIALGLVVLLPVKGLLFYVVLLLAHLRGRNAFLAALSLTAYSEFGLIVASGVPMLNDWMVPLALAVALSFVVAAPLNRLAHPLAERFERSLRHYETSQPHPDEVPPDLSGASLLVFGMGRTGSAAYDTLSNQLSDVIGIDSDPYRVEEQKLAGRRVVLADAEDAYFWATIELESLRGAVLAMDDIEAKVIATRKLRSMGFSGPIVTHVLHADQIEGLEGAGADQTHLTMQEAGASLGHHALTRLGIQPESRE